MLKNMRTLAVFALGLWVGFLGVVAAPRSASAAASREIASMPEPRWNHTTIRVPDGRVLLLGGRDSDNYTLDVLAFVPSTQTWENAGQLLQTYTAPDAVLLADGRILILALYPEIFDPNTGKSVPAPPMLVPREASTSIPLEDGRILCIGGGSGVGVQAEVFDPTTSSWMQVPSSAAFERNSVTAVRLLDGRVLIVGGLFQNGIPVPQVEVFDPQTNSWSIADQPMHMPRQGPAAVVLRDGRLFVGGGLDAMLSQELASAEIFDPATGAWKLLDAKLTSPRHDAASMLLPDGRVAILGGNKFVNQMDWSFEIFDPRSEAFNVLGEMAVKRPEPKYTLLADGQVLITGGTTDVNSDNETSVELIDPRAHTWVYSEPLVEARAAHAAARLTDGRVLVLGGNSKGFALSSAEVLDPVTLSWRTLQASMTEARAVPAIAPLRHGRVLVTGGEKGDISLASAEIFDEKTEQFTPVAAMSFERAKHAATTLVDGRVLITGGIDSGGNELDAVEIFDPQTLKFSLLTAMRTPRNSHRMTLLNDGRVLVTGGSPSWADAEIFDPQRAEWLDAGTFGETRYNHVAIKLLDGQVLVAGGVRDGKPLADAWLFDPGGAAGGTWTQVESMLDARSAASAALLPDGRVLVAGGYFQLSPLPTAEVFDPMTQKWSPLSSMGSARVNATATSLPDGRILIIGGIEDPEGASKVVEIFGRALGTGCDTGADCVRGVCVDGVCCDDGCIDTEVCRVCTIRWGAKQDGMCSASTENCGAYTCNAVVPKPTCKEACLSASDCGPAHVCALSGDCVDPVNFAVHEGCVTAHGDRSTRSTSACGPFALLAGIALWRRRSRRTSPMRIFRPLHHDDGSRFLL